MAETTKPGCLAQSLTGLAGMYILGVIKLFIEGEWSAGGCAVLILIILLLAGIGMFGSKLADESARAVGDKRTHAATDLAVRLKARESVPPFNCFLRPFDTTGHLYVENSNRVFGSGIDMMKPQYLDLETEISDALANVDILFAALGKPGEHIGAGRIAVSDDEWGPMAALLILNAYVIFAVPGASKGTLSEMRFLKETGRIEQTILIMPPADSQSRPSATDAEKMVRERWIAAREQSSLFGLQLPEYRPEGLFFVLRADGGVRAERPIAPYFGGRRLANDLTELMAQMPPSHSTSAHQMSVAPPSA